MPCATKPPSMTDFWRRLACAIGWHVLTFRADEYGDYVGCVFCDFADTQAVRQKFLNAVPDSETQ